MLNLKDLENNLDDKLKKETKLSLTIWLLKIRIKQYGSNLYKWLISSRLFTIL